MGINGTVNDACMSGQQSEGKRKDTLLVAPNAGGQEDLRLLQLRVDLLDESF